MKKLRLPVFALALGLAFSSFSCATPVTWPSVWNALKKCENVDWSLATRVFGDLVEIASGNSAGENDLVGLLEADTVGAVPCLLDYFQNGGGSTADAASKFKNAHAAQVQKARARGGAASLGCHDSGRHAAQGDPARDLFDGSHETASGEPSTGGLVPPSIRGRADERLESVAPQGAAFAYAGTNVGAAASACDERCGSTDAIASPGGPCLCQRRVDGRLTWVAAR